ncbi:histone chaperone [Chamberlinius hualienensis]
MNQIEEAQAKIEDIKTFGIPEFWLTVFKNFEITADMVQDHDEPILKHLADIKLKLHESHPMGFTLEFHFEPNEYMNNTVLYKEYEIKCAIDESKPFAFDCPEIIKFKGCVIDWKKGKNVTIKKIKTKQKDEASGSVKIVTKTEQTDSFFNFFNLLQCPEYDEVTEALLASDFNIGIFFKERIVPRAVLYFTGEAIDEFSDDYSDTDEEDEDDSGISEDEEVDPDVILKSLF